MFVRCAFRLISKYRVARYEQILIGISWLCTFYLDVFEFMSVIQNKIMTTMMVKITLV